MQVLDHKGRLKLNNAEVTKALLYKRTGDGRYGISAWIQYCHHMLDLGFQVRITEARNSVSKYITVYGIGDDFFKVRFSNHLPILHRELRGDCDFFVGVTNFHVANWTEAVTATLMHFNGERHAKEIREIDREQSCSMGEITWDKGQEESFRRAIG